MDDLELIYQESLDWIHGLGRFGIKPGLERITALLNLLDNPHHKIKFIHIGGTNGKGSTAAMLASILRSAGYSVGLYTSPYLLSFTNRMAVNGADVARSELVNIVNRIRPLVEEIKKNPGLGQMTEFEVVTAIAFTYFAQRDVDMVVLEVGLGGRLDATNIVDPLLSIITNVSLEHTDILGDTVEKIAIEKAGIIKENRPLITASDDPAVVRILEERCRQVNAPYYVVNPVLDGKPESEITPSAHLREITEEGQFFDYRGVDLSLDNLFVTLRGSYQVINAATALAAIELLGRAGYQVEREAIYKGLAETSWPGRLEVLRRNPLLIMDGAHNPAAVKELASAITAYFKFKRLILVIGMMADKDIKTMLEYLIPIADVIVFTRPVLTRAADPQTIADIAVNTLNMQKEYLVIWEHGEALRKALDLAGEDDAVLVTGSLYTVSDARASWLKSDN
jgi:dihydrofolate synthase / folylpolyglutamate synthase